MIFRRKKAPELTNEAHARWLRAGRPPYLLFLGLSAVEQTAQVVQGCDPDRLLVRRTLCARFLQDLRPLNK